MNLESAALIAAASALLALAIGVAALLKAWQGWLDLRRLQIGGGPERTASGEVGELRERVRKLERIALGLD